MSEKNNCEAFKVHKDQQNFNISHIKLQKISLNSKYTKKYYTTSQRANFKANYERAKGEKFLSINKLSIAVLKNVKK